MYTPVRVTAQQIDCVKRVYSRGSEDDLQEACDCQAKSVITDINQNVLNWIWRVPLFVVCCYSNIPKKYALRN